MRPKEKSYYKYVTDTKTIVSNIREYMKKYSNLYRTFDVTNEHCRRFLRKGHDSEGIYGDQLNFRINHWNTKTDCEEGVYLVSREDVHQGGVSELSK